MAEGVQIPFEGINSGLRDTLEEALGLMKALRDESQQTNRTIQQNAQSNVQAAEKLTSSVEQTVEAVATLGKAGTGTLKKDLDQAANSAEHFGETATSAAEEVTASLKNVEKTTAGTIQELKALIAEASKTPKGAEALAKSLDDAQKAALSALVSLGKLTKEEAAIAEQVQKILNAKSTGDIFRIPEQIGLIDQLNSRIELLTQKQRTITDPAAIAGVNDQLRETKATLESLANASNQPLSEQIGLIEQLNSRIDLLTQKRESLTDPLAIASVNDQLREAQDELDKIIRSTAKPVEVFKNIPEQIGLLEQLRSRVELLNQKRNLLADPKQIAKVNDELKQAQSQLDQLSQSTTEPVAQFISLRQQMRLAKEELDRLVEASDGKITPELIAAAKRAGELQDRFEDLNNTVQAFNPDRKFQVFAGIIQNVAGAFTAAQGAAVLFGGEGESITKSLVKIQGALAITQGLQAFFGGLKDNFNNLKLLLVSMTGNATTFGGALVGAFNTIKTAAASAFAVIAANPFVAAAAGAALLVTELVLLSDKAEDLSGEAADLAKSLDRAFEKRTFEADRTANENLLNSERIALEELTKARSEEEKQAIKTRQAVRDAGIEQTRIQDKINELTREQIARQTELDKLNSKQAGEGLNDEELKQLAELATAQRQSVDLRKKLRADLNSAVAKAANDDTQREIDAQDLLIEDTKKRNEERRRLAEELIAAQRELAAKARQALAQSDDPEERLKAIELERQAGQQELDVLKTQFQRKIALVELQRRLTVEAFDKLTEAERQARADALIAAGEVQLTPEQLQQFALLKKSIDQKAEQERLDLLRENAQKRLVLIKDEGEKEREAFELELQARLEGLRKAGATDEQIRKEQQDERDRFRRSQVAKVLDEEEQLGLLRIDAQVRQGETEKEFTRRIELEKLAFQEQIAKERLAQIVDDGTQETAILKAQLQAQLAAIQNARKNIQQQASEEPFDLFKLLGITVTDQQKEAIASGIQDVISLMGTINSIQAQEVQQSISATDQIIADRQRRIDDLQSRLDQELRLNEQGFASNVDLIRQQIEEEEKAAEADKARRRSLLEDQRKIARQQLAVDAVVQASQLATAAAKVFGTESIKGIPGIIAAIGVIASMVSAFLTLKARANAIAQQGAQQFAEGTPYVRRKGAPRGVDTIPAMLTEGEAIIPVKANKRFAPLVSAIVENDIAKARRAALEHLLDGTGVSLSTDAVQQFVEQRQSYLAQTTVNNNMRTERIEKGLRDVRSEIRGLRMDGEVVEHEQHTSTGRIVKRGTTTLHLKR